MSSSIQIKMSIGINIFDIKIFHIIQSFFRLLINFQNKNYLEDIMKNSTKQQQGINPITSIKADKQQKGPMANICGIYIDTKIFQWEIDNVLSLKQINGEYLQSETFTSKGPYGQNGLKWAIRLYPRGENADFENCVSIFVHLLDGNGSNNVEMDWELAIINKKGNKVNQQEHKSCLFDIGSGGTYWGFDEYLTRAQLAHPNKYYIVDGHKLIVQSKISVKTEKLEKRQANMKKEDKLKELAAEKKKSGVKFKKAEYKKLEDSVKELKKEVEVNRADIHGMLIAHSQKLETLNELFNTLKKAMAINNSESSNEIHPKQPMKRLNELQGPSADTQLKKAKIDERKGNAVDQATSSTTNFEGQQQIDIDLKPTAKELLAIMKNANEHRNEQIEEEEEDVKPTPEKLSEIDQMIQAQATEEGSSQQKEKHKIVDKKNNGKSTAAEKGKKPNKNTRIRRTVISSTIPPEDLPPYLGAPESVSKTKKAARGKGQNK